MAFGATALRQGKKRENQPFSATVAEVILLCIMNTGRKSWREPQIMTEYAESLKTCAGKDRYSLLLNIYWTSLMCVFFMS